MTRFAQPVMREEPRQRILALGVLTMLLVAGLALLYYSLNLGTAYVYTFAMLAALSGHTAVSAKTVSDIEALYAAKDHASRWIVEVEFRRQNPA